MRSWANQLLERSPHSTALVTPEGDWTTADLLAGAAAGAKWLEWLGVPVGQPVAALLWSSPTAIALIVGGLLSQRPLAPIGPLLTEAEVSACVAALESPVVVADPSCAPLAETVASRTGTDAVVVPDLRSSPGRAGWIVDPGPSEVGVVLHTSGTSGAPKAVPLTLGRLASRTTVNRELLDLGTGDVYVTAKAIHHVGGLGLALVALGSGAALIPSGRFSLEEWGALSRLGPTHVSLVPTMVELLLGSPGWRPPSLRLLQYGGAPIDPGTLAELVRAEPDLDVVALYGQTEGSPIAYLSAADHRDGADGNVEMLASAGRSAPGVELRIDGAGRDGIGQVVARAEHFFLPGPDGWLRTGDLGRIDRRGYLTLVGRMGDVINRGGESVNPAEVEAVIARHPGVREVAVAGVPDRLLGERVAAWVVPLDRSAPPAEDELRAFARRSLAGFKVPSTWQTCAELPRNPNGKVVRRALSGR